MLIKERKSDISAQPKGGIQPPPSGGELLPGCIVNPLRKTIAAWKCRAGCEGRALRDKVVVLRVARRDLFVCLVLIFLGKQAVVVPPLLELLMVSMEA